MTTDLDTRLDRIEASLAELLGRGGVPQRYLGVRDAARYLGAGEKSIRRLIERTPGGTAASVGQNCAGSTRFGRLDFE